jgi:capsule polysaccharide export protein KpsE/RkpR
MKFTGTASVQQSNSPLDVSEIVAPSAKAEIDNAQNKTLVSLRLLWDNRRLLFRIAIYGLLASTILAFLMPSRYESTARLMPPDNQSTSTALAMAAAQMSSSATGLQSVAGDFLGMKSTGELYVGILNSRTVQDKLVEEFKLKRRFWTMEDARKYLAAHTSVSVDRKSQIIGITVTDHNPQKAAAMTGAYVDELNRLVWELSTSSARRERIFLEGRLIAVNKDLESAEKNFSQFASKNTAIDVKEQGKAMVEAAAILQGQLIAAQSQLEGLKQIYSDNNVRVRSTEARIDELKRQLDKLGGKGESSTELNPQPGDSLYPSIRKLPLLGVEYADLYRNAKIQETVLETLTKEYEMAKVQEAKEIPTVKVLDSPNVPDQKSFPPRTIIVVLGTALAWVLGMAYILGSVRWNAIDASDPGKRFAVEVWMDLKAYTPWISKNGAGSPTHDGRILEVSKTREDDGKEV